MSEARPTSSLLRPRSKRNAIGSWELSSSALSSLEPSEGGAATRLSLRLAAAAKLPARDGRRGGGTAALGASEAAGAAADGSPAARSHLFRSRSSSHGHLPRPSSLNQPANCWNVTRPLRSPTASAAARTTSAAASSMRARFSSTSSSSVRDATAPNADRRARRMRHSSVRVTAPLATLLITLKESTSLSLLLPAHSSENPTSTSGSWATPSPGRSKASKKRVRKAVMRRVSAPCTAWVGTRERTAA
mmetsp:Transcript_3514/g.14557  ORF Transcript_3514/g.14557 Transcript_3514/m.14557 type:complete len:247 (-) Transcript_3514:594-1334(-)